MTTITVAAQGDALPQARMDGPSWWLSNIATVTGRNLLRFTPYRGLDPEVSNFANQAIVRNIDVAPFPPSRSFYFSIDLGF